MYVLGFKSHEIRGDIDKVLATSGAPALAKAIGRRASTVARYAIPSRYLASVWDNARRGFTGQIYVCPDCLRGPNGFAKGIWRTRFAGVCAVHRRFLVGACNRCGTVLRYRFSVGGHPVAHWLDAWPMCEGCGHSIDPGMVAPGHLIDVARGWESAWRRVSEGSGLDDLDWADHLSRTCAADPDFVREIVQCTSPPAGSNYIAVATGFLAGAARRELATANDRWGFIVFRLRLGMRVQIAQFAAAIVDAAAAADYAKRHPLGEPLD